MPAGSPPHQPVANAISDMIIGLKLLVPPWRVKVSGPFSISPQHPTCLPSLISKASAPAAAITKHVTGAQPFMGLTLSQVHSPASQPHGILSPSRGPPPPPPTLTTTAKSGAQENRNFELDCKFLSRLPAASVALLSPNFLARRGAAECT